MKQFKILISILFIMLFMCILSVAYTLIIYHKIIIRDLILLIIFLLLIIFIKSDYNEINVIIYCILDVKSTSCAIWGLILLLLVHNWLG